MGTLLVEGKLLKGGHLMGKIGYIVCLFLGGLRLLQATCKKFYHYCSKHGIALAKRNFTLKYDTNVPRQVSYF